MLVMHQRRAQLGAGHAETQLEQAGAWYGRVYGVVALRGGPEHLWTNTTYRRVVHHFRHNLYSLSHGHGHGPSL